jgi:hypothetical protein
VTKLLIVCEKRGGSMDNPSILQWSGFTALQSLELNRLDLSPGLQQLRGLTQLTHLKMERCSPDLPSFDQLPPGLCSLSLDNLRSNAALHEQQQQQPQVSSSSIPQLPHLTRLVLKGDSAVSSAARVVAALSNLQELDLDRFYSYATDFTLDPLSQLTSLSSLSVTFLGLRKWEELEEKIALQKFPALKQLELFGLRPPPLHGMELAKTLRYLKSIRLNLRGVGSWRHQGVSGGPLQVRVAGLYARQLRQLALRPLYSLCL